MLAAPMLVDDEVVGVITAVSFQEGKTFSSGDVRLYCKFANLCGNVIRQRLREATVRNILLGDTVPEGAIPEIQRVLAHRARPFDRHRRNSRKPRTLSSGRDDVLPICSALVNNIVLLAKELGWKAKS